MQNTHFAFNVIAHFLFFYVSPHGVLKRHRFMRSLGWGFGNIVGANTYEIDHSDDNVWGGYSAPNSYYRLTDFDGYSHTASSALFSISFPSELSSRNTSQNTVRVSSPNLSKGGLCLKDFFDNLVFLYYKARGYAGTFDVIPCSNFDANGNLSFQINSGTISYLSGYREGDSIKVQLCGRRNGIVCSCRNVAGTKTIWTVATKNESRAFFDITYDRFYRRGYDNTLVVEGLRFVVEVTGTAAFYRDDLVLYAYNQDGNELVREWMPIVAVLNGQTNRIVLGDYEFSGNTQYIQWRVTDGYNVYASLIMYASSAEMM